MTHMTNLSMNAPVARALANEQAASKSNANTVEQNSTKFFGLVENYFTGAGKFISGTSHRAVSAFNDLKIVENAHAFANTHFTILKSGAAKVNETLPQYVQKAAVPTLMTIGADTVIHIFDNSRRLLKDLAVTNIVTAASLPLARSVVNRFNHESTKWAKTSEHKATIILPEKLATIAVAAAITSIATVVLNLAPHASNSEVFLRSGLVPVGLHMCLESFYEGTLTQPVVEETAGQHAQKGCCAKTAASGSAETAKAKPTLFQRLKKHASE